MNNLWTVTQNFNQSSTRKKTSLRDRPMESASRRLCGGVADRPSLHPTSQKQIQGEKWPISTRAVSLSPKLDSYDFPMSDGHVDSGIEFDLSSLLSVSDVTEVELEKATAAIAQPESTPQYHELKSRVVVGSPRTDLRNTNMGSRTQLRQTLERQQVLDLEEREKRQAHARQQQQSQNIAMPASYHSAEVPPKVLQVKTELQHPTMYHIKQKQHAAVKSFLSDSDDHQIPAHSMPNLAIPSTVDNMWSSGSAPTERDRSCMAAPDLGDVSGTLIQLSDEDPALRDLIFENSSLDLDTSDLQSITPSLTPMSSTLPQSSLFTPFTLEVDSAAATSSSSCPPVFQGQVSPPNHMSEEEQKLWVRDRQKKDNHNMIERRRRYNINDRIKELGGLLPKCYDQDMRQNKGSILKASVDYIKKLKREVEQLQMEREKKEKALKDYYRLQLRYNQLNMLMKQTGTSLSSLEEMSTSFMVDPSIIMNVQQSGATPQLPAEEPSPSTSFNTFITPQPFAIPAQMDYTMEDSSPISCDPMISAPVSPENDDPTICLKP